LKIFFQKRQKQQKGRKVISDSIRLFFFVGLSLGHDLVRIKAGIFWKMILIILWFFDKRSKTGQKPKKVQKDYPSVAFFLKSMLILLDPFFPEKFRRLLITEMTKKGCLE
jgi:hypothetical protein